MCEKDNSAPLLSPFEIERRARIRRSLVIQSLRGTIRAFAEWLRTFILRTTQLARGLVAQRIYSDIRELQQFDDRMLADIGITTDRGAQFDGQLVRSTRKTRSRAIVAFRLCAAASICLAAGGALLAESATVLSPICAAADLRLMTLIEAHGEAQDVAAETLAQAFFTVVEARKTCNQGQVESAIKLYESIPLGAGTPHSQ
jgi:uncharacterized protein YjiS (DUF1127 family)